MIQLCVLITKSTTMSPNNAKSQNDKSIIEDIIYRTWKCIVPYHSDGVKIQNPPECKLCKGRSEAQTLALDFLAILFVHRPNQFIGDLYSFGKGDSSKRLSHIEGFSISVEVPMIFFIESGVRSKFTCSDSHTHIEAQVRASRSVEDVERLQ